MKKKKGKNSLIFKFIIFFMLLFSMLPLMFIFMLQGSSMQIQPPASIEKVDEYKEVASFSGIDWEQLFIYDFIKYEDLEEVDPYKSALDFYVVTYTVSEYYPKKGWQIVEKIDYDGQEKIKNFFNKNGVGGELTVNNFFDGLEEIQEKLTEKSTSTKKYSVSKRVKTFEEAIANFSKDDQELALSLYEEGTITELYGEDLNFVGIPGVDPTLPPIDIGNVTGLPYFNQGDKRWGDLSYGGTTIREGGCGPTSMAMIIVGFTGKTDVNPKVMADWSVKHGYRVEGQGTAWGFMTAAAKEYGINSTQIGKSDSKAIVKALSEGKPIIASMGKGHFTKGGHFIVLKGITKEGKILVNDCASIKRTGQEWDLSIIMNEAKAFWAYSK